MSIGLMMYVAITAPQGRAVTPARAHMERMSACHSISTLSQGRLINRWWVSRGLHETAVAGNTETHRAPLEPYEVLRLDPRAIARRSVGFDENPTAGVATSARSQVSPKMPAEKAETPKSAGPLSLVNGRRVRAAAAGCGNCGNAEIQKDLEIRASERIATRHTRTAGIAENAGRRRSCAQADQPSRERPIAIDTAAWLGSTTGRPTCRCSRSR